MTTTQKQLDLVTKIELSIQTLFSICDDLESAGAAWASVSSATERAARTRVEQLGGDIDALRASLDGFFLTHPDV